MLQAESLTQEDNSMLSFKCEQCESNRLEEIVMGATQSKPILDIIDDGEPVYGTMTTDGGEIAGFQCADCGLLVKNDGETIHTYEELVRVLAP